MTEDDVPAESASDESAATHAPTTPIDADAAFDLLADAERRAILTRLRESDDGTATTTELVDCILRRQGDGETGDRTPIAEGGERDDRTPADGRDVLARDRATVRLHHTHLPKLADVGVVDYDERSETVRYWGNSFLEALLDAANHEPE